MEEKDDGRKIEKKGCFYDDETSKAAISFLEGIQIAAVGIKTVAGATQEAE